MTMTMTTANYFVTEPQPMPMPPPLDETSSSTGISVGGMRGTHIAKVTAAHQTRNTAHFAEDRRVAQGMKIPTTFSPPTAPPH